MTGEALRQPRQGSSPRDWGSLLNSLSFAAAYLVLVGFFDYCLFSPLHALDYSLGSLGKEVECLAALVAQTVFLALLVRRAIPSPAVAVIAFVLNLVLVNALVAVYASKNSHFCGFACALLVGQLGFLAIWLMLSDRPLGWRVLVTTSAAGVLIVGWYGYAARRSTAEWNTLWMTQTLAMLGLSLFLRQAGFRIRHHTTHRDPSRSAHKNDSQFELWHLLAGTMVASMLFGLARHWGVISPTYLADLMGHESDSMDVQTGILIGLAAAMTVACGALGVLLRGNGFVRYALPLLGAVAVGHIVHVCGPSYVDMTLRRSLWYPSGRGWLPTTSQWPIWMLLAAGIAMAGTMFLHALGYRLMRAPRPP